MWSQIDINDVTALTQWLNIARQMDQRYQFIRLGDVQATMRRKQGEAWYYQQDGVEMSILFQYSHSRRHWQLGHVGFLGPITPEDALDRMVERVRDFLTAHSASSVFGLKPPQMDHPPIQQLHNLVPGHPNLQVTVQDVTGEGEIWEIAYVASPS